MLRSLILAITALAIVATGETAKPPAHAQIQQASMPDYIVNMNRQNTIVGRWQLTTRDGTTTADYRPDGTFSGHVTPTGYSHQLPFFGYYSYTSLGGDRFQLTTRLPMPRGKTALTHTDTFRLEANGTLRSESTGAVAYRLR